MLRVLSRPLPAWCRILTVLLMALEFGLLGVEIHAAQRTKRSKKTVVQSSKASRPGRTAKVSRSAKQSTVRRAATGTRSRRRRVRRSRRARPFVITALTSVKDSSLGQGARYVEYRTNGKTPIVVHALVLDRSIPGNALRLVKAEDHTFGLERLGEMTQRFSTTSRHTVYGLVNGNFWRAVRNTLIGPCVIDGEVVEMNSYKKWSSAFFDVRSAMTIDTFTISGTVSIGQRQLAVSTVNHRDDQGVVVYNEYAGNTVPYVSPKQIERAFQEAMKDTIFIEQDSTEAALTQDVLRQEIARARRERDAEFPMLKIRVRYLRSPSVNVPIPCEVLSADTGTVTMPIRGAVISVPRSTFVSGEVPKIGDTVRILYRTNIAPQTPFMNAVCGTPRLVRKGVAKHEAMSEGSTGQRFISHALARCAIGADSSGARLMLVAVPADRPERRTVGATLQQMAQIMGLLGCREALNLDGGGSAGMVVGSDHVFFDGVDPLTRRVGLGVGLVKLSKILRGGAR